MPYFFYSFPYRLSALMSIAALVFVIAANAQSSGNSGLCQRNRARRFRRRRAERQS